MVISIPMVPIVDPTIMVDPWVTSYSLRRRTLEL